MIARPTLNSITQDFVQSIALVKVIYGYRVNIGSGSLPRSFNFFFFSVSHANKKKGKDKLNGLRKFNYTVDSFWHLSND